MRRSWRLIRNSILSGLAFLLVDRGLDSLLLSDGMFAGRPVAPFDPPIFCDSQRKALAVVARDVEVGRLQEHRFDADLGWCYKPNSGFGEFRYDWAGARMGPDPLPREKSPGVRRVVTVGCSMTHGEEVPASKSWCARVDALMEDVEIANLGVAAYGTDQALLRLRRDGWSLQPDEVWLGVLPSAALRTTTSYRPLLDHWSLDVAFKPRFSVAGDGSLLLHSNPARNLSDVIELLSSQQRFLAALGDDPWVARARAAYEPRGASLLHESFCGRLALTLFERGGRSIEGCFDESQPFGQLFTTIAETMAAECSQRGAEFRILVLPGRSDMESRGDRGRGYWEGWSEEMMRRGIRVLDLSSALEGADFDELYMPGGHYSEAASELVAQAIIRADRPGD